jgi:hypothetical protein
MTLHTTPPIPESRAKISEYFLAVGIPSSSLAPPVISFIIPPRGDDGIILCIILFAASTLLALTWYRSYATTTHQHGLVAPVTVQLHGGLAEFFA